MLSLFNVQIDPDQVKQSSIARPDGFRATEKLAVPFLRVENPKIHLADAARPYTTRAQMNWKDYSQFV